MVLRKKKYYYGMRWASKGFFSAIKRMFGENIGATSVEGMIQEVKMKCATQLRTQKFLYFFH